MSTQNKYDLLLLGNAIVDEVYCIPKWAEQGTSNTYNSYRVSVGGIGNIVEALKNTDLKIAVECIIGNDTDGKIIDQYFNKRNIETKLYISNKSTSKALILSDLNSKERTSFVNWGCGAETFLSDKKALWTHISYLDVIPFLDLNNIRTNANIVSADLCLSNPIDETINLIYNQLQYLDYLFISEAELKPLLNSNNLLDFINKYKLKCLMYHTKYKTIIINNIMQQEILGSHALSDNIDVLGAGDAYCANFIHSKLNNNDDIKAALYAHEQATKFVLSRI